MEIIEIGSAADTDTESTDCVGIVSFGGNESISTRYDSVGCINTESFITGSSTTGEGTTDFDVINGSLIGMDATRTLDVTSTFRLETLVIGIAAANGTEATSFVNMTSFGGNTGTVTVTTFSTMTGSNFAVLSVTSVVTVCCVGVGIDFNSINSLCSFCISFKFATTSSSNNAICTSFSDRAVSSLTFRVFKYLFSVCNRWINISLCTAPCCVSLNICCTPLTFFIPSSCCLSAICAASCCFWDRSN